jgi:hypothetical protein
MKLIAPPDLIRAKHDRSREPVDSARPPLLVVPTLWNQPRNRQASTEQSAARGIAGPIEHVPVRRKACRKAARKNNPQRRPFVLQAPLNLCRGFVQPGNANNLKRSGISPFD